MRVICRFRPSNEREKRENVAAKQADGVSLDVLDTRTVQVVGPGTKEVLNFSFDHVFGETAGQRQVYEVTARDTVQDMLDGYNGTIFAYGQTGAGKTFTMTSNLDGSPETRGIIPRACAQLFSHIEQDTSGTEYTIKCSFLEIYKETLRDLLDPKSLTKLKIRETPARGVWVEGLTEAFVASQHDIISLLQLGEQSRATASTNMNAVSSRSHSLFVITLVQKLKDGSTKSSRLNLADLAGSEKVGKTGATGETLEEAKKINQSLSALGNCIVALTKSADKRKHVPYRDSKLTFILRESLGGNSKTTLLIACSPHLYNLEETISTLRFGQRAKSIKNQVKINAHRSVTELEMIVTKLQAEVTRLRAYSKTLEQELTTRCPNETIDFQALQEKAWKNLKGENSENAKSSTAHSSSAAGPTSFAGTQSLTPPVPSVQGATRSKRALSGSQDSNLSAPLPRPRARADSDRMEFSASPSSSLSFLTDSISDGTRSPPSEADSDFWTPMNLVEAQIAYDKMKEEMEFKLQDALEELAQAKDENGIETLKNKLTQEFEEYKATHDAKLAEVQTLSAQLFSQIASATEQAESLAEQLNVTSEERDSLQTHNNELSDEIMKLNATVEEVRLELKQQLSETEKRLSSENANLQILLSEQQEIATTKSSNLEESVASANKLSSDLDQANEARNALKLQVASQSLEIESLKASLATKDAQLVESTSSVSKMELKLQELFGRAEEQGKASGEGLKMLGDLNKSLTEKNHQLFEEKNTLMTQLSELQLKLDIAVNSSETQKEQRSADVARIAAMEAELNNLKADLEQTKLSSNKRVHQLELQAKDFELLLVEEKRLTLQSQLQVERSKVETEVARADSIRLRADLEKEIAAMAQKAYEEKRSLEGSLASKSELCTSQADQLKEMSAQLADAKSKLEKLNFETKSAADANRTRIQSLEEDLTDARVALRRAKEEVELLREERAGMTSEISALSAANATAQSELASFALKTPSKASHSIVGRDPTTMMRQMDSHALRTPNASSLNSRIAVPVSQSLMFSSASSASGGFAAGLLKNGANAKNARPAAVAGSILSTPSAGSNLGDRSMNELSAWLMVCTCVGGGANRKYSSGWRRLWVVVKDKKVTCYENQEQRTIVEALQVTGCQIWQLPDTTRMLVEQPTDFTFVIISNPDDLDAIGENSKISESEEQQLYQDEYAFAAPSPELLDTFVQHFLRMDCEPLAFSTLRLETLPPNPNPSSSASTQAKAPTNTTPNSKTSAASSAFSKLGASTSASTSSGPASTNSSANSTPGPRSFLSGLFG